MAPTIGLTCHANRRCSPGNTLTGPPIIFEQIARLLEFSSADLSRLRTAPVGGARVPAVVLSAWAPRGVALRQRYGQTEIGGSVIVTLLAEAYRSNESCGRGAAYARFRVAHVDGNDWPPVPPLTRVRCAPEISAGWTRTVISASSTGSRT